MNDISDYPDRICLRGMSFHGNTGVFDFEKRQGQTFVVDLTLCFCQLQAVETDYLTDTVHYGDVFTIVKNIVETEKYDLLERLAGRIISCVFEEFPLPEAVEAIVSKPDAPVDGIFDAMSVRIFRERTKY